MSATQYWTSPVVCGTEMGLGPDTHLSCEQVERVAGWESASLELTPAALSAMEASYQTRLTLTANGTPIYGVTTGFGPFVAFSSGEGVGGYQHGAGLIAHLGAGWGESAPEEVVRATMLIRAQNIAQGYSGIHPDLLRAYLRLLEIGITPCVPAIGSVGASGDLIPLSFIARALSGSSGSPDARVVYQNREMPAAEALALAGLMPMALEGRDALSLTNGTSFLTAYATIAVARAERLLAWGEKLTGWLYRLLGARTAALDPRLHEVRGHIGQYESAENIRQEVERFGTSEDTTRQLQEVYSLRCAPQILGACRDSLTFARQLVETEINGCSDNPVFIAEGEAVLHGGNFQGQQVAFAADALNAALTQAGVLAERQVDLLVTPSESNGNAPLLLSWEPGPASGFAGAQITATALVAEMRSNTQAHATMSIPTNGRNQDVVSMGTLAARKCYEQTERLAGILAILSLTAGQFRFLSQRGKAVGRDTPPPSGLPPFEGLTQDRPLHNDIRTTASAILTPLHSKE